MKTTKEYERMRKCAIKHGCWKFYTHDKARKNTIYQEHPEWFNDKCEFVGVKQ